MALKSLQFGPKNVNFKMFHGVEVCKGNCHCNLSQDDYVPIIITESNICWDEQQRPGSSNTG